MAELTKQQAAVLQLLRARGAHRPCNIHRKTMSHAQVAGALRALMKAGLVQRQGHPYLWLYSATEAAA